MWISVIGPEGSGKSVVAKVLKELNFELLGDGSRASMKYYFDVDKEASYKAIDHNVFTIGSFWDFHECVVPFYHSIYKTSDEEKLKMDQFYNETKELIEPPNVIIYTKVTREHAHNRLLLTGEGQQLIQNIQAQIILYDQFMDRVNVPVIELDMSRTNRIVADLKFGIDSVSSLRHTRQTVWRRTMLREE